MTQDTSDPLAQSGGSGPTLVGPRRGEGGSLEALRALTQLQDERAILNYDRCEQRVEFISADRIVIHGTPSVQLDFSSEEALQAFLQGLLREE